MKKYLRYITLTLALILLSSLVLSSCSGSKSYKTDVAVSTLSDAAKKQIEISGGYMTTDPDYIEFNLEGLPTPKEFEIFMASNSSANKNEVGIFPYENTTDAENAKAVVKKYLVAKDESYKAAIDYTPNEYPKIENAKVVVFGNYVVYTILTVDDSEKVTSAIENLLVQ